MSEKIQKLDDVRVDPIRTTDFGVAQHKYRQFNAVVPSGTDPKSLINPRFWSLIASQLSASDEVRVVAEDGSMVATLFVHFVSGSDVRVGLLHSTTFKDVSDAYPDTESSVFEVKFLPQKKFIVRNKQTGEIKFENIATKSEAYRQLEEYETALRS